MPESLYLIRYGSMANVGRFHFNDEADGAKLARGESVVIRTDRGMELGEVLARQVGPANSFSGNDLRQGATLADEKHAVVLRRATSEDEASVQAARSLHVTRFQECERVLLEAGWPGELIEVETLLDGQTVVLHYVAFEEFDTAVLRARFRVMCDLEAVMERVGGELVSAEDDSDLAENGGCSSGGCSTGGGCGSGGCGSGGCSTGGCGVAAVKRAARSVAGSRAGTSDQTA